MTECERWEQQPGGLFLAVQRFDKTNQYHRDAASDVLRSVVQTVSSVHNASFNAKGFHNNMQALYRGDIFLDLYLAKWEVCARSPVCVGAALNWKTVGISSDGRNVKGIYSEDVCLMADRLRQLIRRKPEGKDFPEESLAECFERLSLKNMLENGEYYKFGEVNPDNVRMIRSLVNNGGVFGKEGDSAVLEFKAIPSLFDKLLIDLPIAYPRKRNFDDEDLFVVRWHEGESDIRFIATKGQATAAGKPRVDIRPWHNGVLPDHDTLEFVVASALFAIKNEVENQGWGNQKLHDISSPSIPIGGNKGEAVRALYEACGSETIIPIFNAPPTLWAQAPDAHVFIIRDKRMLTAFEAVGAKPRLFGTKPMMPGVNVLDRGICLTA